MRRRRPRLGHHQHTRRVAIEPMHQAGPLGRAEAQPVEQRVEMVAHLAAALYGETGRLVEGEDVFVPMNDPAPRGLELPLGRH